MTDMKRVLIASDHAGFALKSALVKNLSGWTLDDLGPLDESRVDYPDYARMVAEKVAKKEAAFGILICGSGIGMSIAANKVSGIRAALVENPVAARLSREHNDSNVLCLGSRFIAPEYGLEIVQVWLSTAFSGDARHIQRLNKVRQLEQNN